ncbi:hypothetical protein AYO41_02630 [Verrucomicrobia bacterium SCGC AG-212-E04]|nr:hypothetical protein AYO41_02630 [Verrucomicrobia bacterium SCGC AG-212-E04]
MTDSERLQILKQLKTAFQGEILRSGAPVKNEHFAELWPALDFNEQYCVNAQDAAGVLSKVGLGKADYEKAATELNMIIGQAISELEHGLRPPPPEALESN